MRKDVMGRTIRFMLEHPIAGKFKSRALFRYLWWQASSRLKDKVTVEWIGGTKLVASHGMTGATGNIYCGLHEFPEMGFLLHLLRPSDLFCDVGANIGSYTILASGVAKAETLAFEPVPETIRSLSANIQANRIAELVSVHEVVLGPQDGMANFSIDQDTMNHVARKEDQVTRLLPMRKLDTVLNGRCPIFLKIDVEGYEEEVFSGAQLTLSDPRLLAICTELFTPKMSQALGRMGFSRFYYNPYTRDLTPFGNALKHSNTLLVRDHESVQARLRAAPSFRVFRIDI
ncbi:FkbM family methyltransferase [Mesorhizobium sp. M0633]|uniref:FkbM family methyltransferase n=1 Tax=Mesorhizobium sp. M0633 TaxID=2956977 RepID=UPI003335A7F4